jgi:hypothetical protein
VAAVVGALAPAIALADHAPTASFTWAPATPVAGQPVTLTSTSTPDRAPIKTTEWDFDGDEVVDAVGPSVTTTFATSGDHPVTLRVVDAAGNDAKTSQTIPVGSPVPPPAPPPTIAPAAQRLPAPASPAPASPAPASPAPASPAPAPSLMSPFPIVRIQGRILARGIVVTRLTVLAPSGVIVRAVCLGARRGCPRRTVVARSRSAAVPVRLRALERRLRAGAVLQIYVTAPGRIGKYTRFRVRNGGPPIRRDLCIASAARTPSACPGA